MIEYFTQNRQKFVKNEQNLLEIHHGVCQWAGQVYSALDSNYFEADMHSAVQLGHLCTTLTV